jgi:hypothetical protein
MNNEEHLLKRTMCAPKESGTEPARRSCYNKAHDLEHGIHTPALLGKS